MAQVFDHPPKIWILSRRCHLKKHRKQCVGWFVSKITQKLLHRFPKNLDVGCVSAPLTFGADPDVWTDPGFFFLPQTSRDREFFNILVNFSGINAWILMKENLAYLGRWYL